MNSRTATDANAIHQCSTTCRLDLPAVTIEGEMIPALSIPAGMSQVVKNEKGWDLLPVYLKEGESARIHVLGNVVQDDGNGGDSVDDAICNHASAEINGTYSVAMGTVR